ncbi:MAG: S46 family peptidase, partial [Ignavibacteriae bacterium]|nr:S46 family peptidase [Ignavibacteriota bacterium]
ITILCIFLFTAWIAPDEGMWMLTQLEKLPWSEMKNHGLELTPEQIYNPDGTSLKDAIVLLGGGTSSFVSAEGLLLTNHHVAFAAIQSVSSVEDDYLKNGFYAKTREAELSIPTYTAQIVVSIQDVTDSALSVVSDTMTADARLKAIQAKSREIEKAAKGSSDDEYRVAETYSGVKYYLFGYEVLKDIRLVYAPPTSIGNYGGEVDNWYWPRHTGDFAFMRAYVDTNGKSAKYAKHNVPYKPKVFLPFSTKGYNEGSYAMVMGYPGRTFRYRTSYEIQLAKDEILPLTMELFKKRMDIITAAGEKNRALEIKYATRWRGMANTYKNYQGTLEGMRRANLLKQRLDQEEKFREFINSKPDLQAHYGTVLSDIAKTYEELQTFNKKQIVFGQIFSGSSMLGIANRLRNFANSFARDTTGRIRPSETSLMEMKEFINTSYKNVEISVERELLRALLLKVSELPEDQQIQVCQRIVGKRTGEARENKVRDFVDDLFDDTKLKTQEGALKLLEKSADDIQDDEFVKFAMELDKDNSQLQAQVVAFNAKIGLLRAKLLEAWTAWKGPDLYPDANRTLRLSYGTVQPYKPRDAVHYHYVTTLGGVMEKESGEDPFIVPPKLKELWENKDFGIYADSTLKDVPVAFTADLDITGGNSGSPIINGKGELIGLAFDGNWEAVVGDYLYQEPLNRAISVDARYILFILDKYSSAQTILNELVIK